MLAFGFFLARAGKLDEKGKSLVSLLTIRIALPCNIFRTMLVQYGRDALLGSMRYVLAALLVMFAGYALAYGLSFLLRVPATRRGVFLNLSALSNTVFVGFPVVRAMLGEEGVAAAVMFYMANTAVFWTVGNLLMQGDARAIAAGKGVEARRMKPTELAKHLFSPSFTTLMVSILLMAAGFTPPRFLADACQYMGSMVTPLSMVFVGAMLYEAYKRGIKWERGLAGVLTSRFVFGPLLAVAFTALIGMTGVPRRAFFLEGGMASMAQISIVAHGLGADGEYGAMGGALTTVGMLAVLPVYALVLNYL